MKRTETLLAITLLIVAVLACIGVVYFQWMLDDDEAAYTQNLQNTQQAIAEQHSAVAMHAQAQDSAQARSTLDGLLSPDIVSIASTLRDVGKATGVSLTLGGAIPEEMPTQSSVQQGIPISAVSFSLEADGSFAALMRTLQLIETLPLPSYVERFDIQKGTGANSSWHMDISIRVLTTSNVSS